MSVYKVGKVYQTDFEFKGRRYKQTTNTASKKEAKEIEFRRKEEVKAQYDLLGNRPLMSLGEAIERYFLTAIKPKSSAVVQKNATYYLGLIEGHFGAATIINNITQADVADFQASLLKTTKANTANRYCGVLNALLNAAVDWGVLAVAPRVSPLTINDERLRFLDSDEQERLLAASPAWLHDLLVFYLDTGARKQEALGLAWQHVHFTPTQGRPFVRFTNTKNKEQRSIPLTRRCQEMLNARRERSGPGESAPVFTRPANGSNQEVPVGDFKKSWATVKAAAGIKDLRIHDLRHTFASRLVMRAVPILNVSKLLGHKTLKMTLRYAHLAPEALDAAIAKLDD